MSDAARDPADPAPKRPATEASKKADAVAERLGCLLTIVVWIALVLHFCGGWLWDKEPAFLKWIVIGYGALVLLGLVGSLIAGRRSERIVALAVLVIIALLVAVGRLL